jgi:hypothetical protein
MARRRELQQITNSSPAAGDRQVFEYLCGEKKKADDKSSEESDSIPLSIFLSRILPDLKSRLAPCSEDSSGH